MLLVNFDHLDQNPLTQGIPGRRGNRAEIRFRSRMPGFLQLPDGPIDRLPDLVGQEAALTTGIAPGYGNSVAGAFMVLSCLSLSIEPDLRSDWRADNQNLAPDKTVAGPMEGCRGQPFDGRTMRPLASLLARATVREPAESVANAL